MKPYAPALLSLFVLLGCMTPVEPEEDIVLQETCSSPPAQDPQSYFPLQVGQRWIYQYNDYVSVLPFLTHTSGTLTWHVASEQCQEGKRIFAIEESFRGEAVTTSYEYERRTAAAWDTTRSFVFGDSLALDLYTAGPIGWRYSASSADTMIVYQAACVSESGCLLIELVRGRGLVRHVRRRHVLASANYETALALVEIRQD